jgi:hypothetical protein
MADYYLEFSQVLPNLTVEEADWLQGQLEIVHVFDVREYSAASLPAELAPANADWSGCRAYRDLADCEPDEEVGFQYEFRDDPEHEFGRHLWVYAEECGDLERLAHLVQKFLCRFRPNQSWGVSYALTCSKPRLDSFGGGAVFVTAKSIAFNSSFDFLERAQAEFVVE